MSQIAQRVTIALFLPVLVCQQQIKIFFYNSQFCRVTGGKLFLATIFNPADFVIQPRIGPRIAW